MSDAIHEPAGSHEPTEHAKTRRRPRPAAGSVVRWSTTTSSSTRRPPPLVFPTIFFPSDNPQVGIVASFATFGVGYLARPIGAFVLGHWGDTHGRKTVLVLCMLMMGGSTFAVALLPTYDAIGIWAPILLVTLRLIQLSNQRSISSIRSSPSTIRPPRRSPCQIIPSNLPGNSGRTCHLPPKVIIQTVSESVSPGHGMDSCNTPT
jgi:hypothetical protein